MRHKRHGTHSDNQLRHCVNESSLSCFGKRLSELLSSVAAVDGDALTR